jgi:hypothetical protein
MIAEAVKALENAKILSWEAQLASNAQMTGMMGVYAPASSMSCSSSAPNGMRR